MKKLISSKKNVKFSYLLPLLGMLFFTNCIKMTIKGGKDCYVYAKVLDIIVSISGGESYDSTFIYIEGYNKQNINEIPSECNWKYTKKIVIDTITSIEVITLYKYNAQYDSLDTMTNNFLVIYQNKTYPSIHVFLSSEKPPLEKILLKLIAPPDQRRTLQLKFLVTLKDGRTITYITHPRNIAP